MTLLEKGATREIEWYTAEEVDDADSAVLSASSRGLRPQKHLQPYLNLHNSFPGPDIILESALIEELDHKAVGSQGREYPGMSNPETGFDYFKKQTKGWKGIAGFHLENVIRFAISFVEQLLDEIIGPDQKTRKP